MIEVIALFASVVIACFSGRSAFLTLIFKGAGRLVSTICGVLFGLFSLFFAFAGALPLESNPSASFASSVAIWAIFALPWAWIVFERKQPKPKREHPADEGGQHLHQSPSDKYQLWYAEAKRLGHSTEWNDWKIYEKSGRFVSASEKRIKEAAAADYALRNANPERGRTEVRSRGPRRSRRVKKSLSIVYEDANGDVSDRTIDTVSFDGVKIEAWCRLRSEERTFYASRIISCIDEETGEVVDDVAGYLSI